MCTGTLDRRADRGRGPGRRRARLRGGAGPVPGRGRPGEPGATADHDGDSWTCRRAASEDAAAHLREALQIAARTGGWFELLNDLDCCGLPVRRDRAPRRGRHGVGRARRAHRGSEEIIGDARDVRHRQEPLRQARQALGSARARAAEERGAAMSMATAAEYALLLTDPGPPQPAAQGRGRSAPGNGSWSPWSPRAAPTPRSPRSCTSASAPSAPTWTGSGTRPAAAAAPT